MPPKLLRFACFLAALLTTATALAQPAPVVPPGVPVSRPTAAPDSGAFRFVIMADRTGGMRPGVFDRAVERVNLLAPEFILSVGDLIDGYTEDPAVWEAQWTEVERLVGRLEAPFFYVPGNHDISNPTLGRVWRERRGAPYYHFVYCGVLFLCLNTEDIPGTGGILPDQVAYARRALADHPDARWTLVFMHRPLWSYGDQDGYEAIEALLRGRTYTVFSGHHHNYQTAVRNGARHYVLGTTGGGSDLRGPDVGEFEHVTLVTMRPDGPRVAHLTLDGILPDDVVPEADYAVVQQLRLGGWFAVDPVVSPTPQLSRAATTLRFVNTGSRPLRVSGTLGPQHGLRFAPATLDVAVPPADTLVVPVEIVADVPLAVADLAEAAPALTLTARIDREGRAPVALDATRPLVLDWQRRLPRRDTPPTLDGTLAEWDTTAFLRARRPAYLQEGWDWQGPVDGWFRFGLGADDRSVYLAVETFDEHAILSPDALAKRQDQLFVVIEPAAGAPLRLALAPGADGRCLVDDAALPAALRPRVACRRTAGGFTAEVALPRAAFGPGAVRLNVGLMDHDRPENTKPSVLWWRPLAGTPGHYPAATTFDAR